jgi:hypothetical protein
VGEVGGGGVELAVGAAVVDAACAEAADQCIGVCTVHCAFSSMLGLTKC